jgi:hypothetical protein
MALPSLPLADMNNYVGALQANLPYSWNTFENAYKEFNNPFGSRLSKDIVCNTEGKKLIEFCERIFLKLSTGYVELTLSVNTRLQSRPEEKCY